jgi:hypothetical protein
MFLLLDSFIAGKATCMAGSLKALRASSMSLLSSIWGFSYVKVAVTRFQLNGTWPDVFMH